jgi:hypothetical protein
MNRSLRHRAWSRSAWLTSACAFGSSCGLPADSAPTEPEAEATPAEEQGTNAAALTRATSCDDVLSRIQSSTIERLLVRAEELRQPPSVYAGEPGVVIDTGEALAPQPVSASPESLSDNPLLAGAGSANAGTPDADFSGTTVQVAGVDEPDVIEADGDYLYVLQGSQLVKLRAWPAAQTETLATVAIEGSPYNMFVSGGKAIVFSSVYRDLGAPPVMDPSYGYYYPYYYPTFTKLTVLDVEQDAPAVLRESYLEGYYVSSRSHDGVVRAVIQDNYKVPSLDGVYIEYFTPFGEPYRQRDIDAQVDAWLERTLWAVTETELDDWLPRQFTSVDGEVVAAPRDCSDYYQPDLDLSRSGVTQIFSLDVGSDDGSSPLDAATVLARAERVYQNERVVLLAQTDYGSFETNYSETTNLHRFDLDGDGVAYTASGQLPGYIQSQFSLDEHEGTIRVSTTENRWGGGMDGQAVGPKNRVFTLDTEAGSLDVMGQTEVFGAGEQIFATRFIGDLGYVVTFRQVDPLFVVDLSDPSAPAVVGELHIPGFSNFLFPLDDTHLFAIGRDATETGVTLGVALKIFDISDPSAPSVAHEYVYSGEAYSDANFDHHAMTFHPDGGRIAFPLTDWRTGQSSIEVLDVDADSGFTRRGALMPVLPEYTLEECVVLLGYGEDALDGWLGTEIATWPELADQLLAQCRGSEQMRRGLLRAETVYGISTRAVYAQAVSELGQPPTIRAPLPEAYYYDSYPVPVGGGIAGAAGAAGAGFGGGSFDMGAAGTAAAESGGAGGAPADLP